ncbi:uncharacterized protein BO87DRAFT_453531 [Aspergillus neoniger CBS 115656]|uniref:Helicase C-terminal domain-containing protein n=1 Tax=Aspergillus neoniger (strain CBS 115656) TaxID=1448310 RepID=A0A318YQ55_ASPNB|nr:hypothetical protein BO87DRAFT_453531 [Aspergillus neoniger CBS 115656]PYH36519.1 hypothetical protein BO87DRAFT_453531 [Aspergillus neoniger CBS 115656]
MRAVLYQHITSWTNYSALDDENSDENPRSQTRRETKYLRLQRERDASAAELNADVGIERQLSGGKDRLEEQPRKSHLSLESITLARWKIPRYSTDNGITRMRLWWYQWPTLGRACSLWDFSNNKHHNHVQLVQTTCPNITILSLCYHFCIGKPCKIGIYIGTTGTRAAHVILMETDWCSTNHKQVFGRCHRIGQRAKVVFAYVFQNTQIECEQLALDKHLARLALGKTIDSYNRK